MARGVRLNIAAGAAWDRFAGSGVRLWAGIAGLLMALALLAMALPPTTIDWQPGLALTEPWRAFTAAALHYSRLHLGANLAGALLVAALGVVARVPPRCGFVWLAAWPLTQFGLLLQPGLAHFGGMSGVLHAGVAVVGVFLIVRAHGPRRAIGAALLTGLAVKLLSESPWVGSLRHVPGWDITIAPLSHASGALAGLVCALLAETVARRRGGP